MLRIPLRRFAVLLVVCIGAMLSACNGTEHDSEDGKRFDAAEETAAADDMRIRQLKLMDETAVKMFKEVMDGNILQARQYMEEIGDLALQIEYAGITSVEGIEAFTSAVVQARNLMNAIQTEPSRLQIAAAQVRLSTDALLGKQPPLWHDYYQTMRDDTEQLKRSIEQRQHVLASAQQLQRHYAIIRPAVLISQPPEVNGKIESLLSFFLQQANRPEARLLEQAHELSRTWDELFERKNVSAYLPVIDEQQPIYWSLVIGSIIITVLAFVAWNKYRADLAVVSVDRPGNTRRDDR